MDQHHDQVETNIPELGGMVLTSLEEIIQFDTLVAAFRRSPFVVHPLPLIAFTRRSGIEPDVGFHGNGAGSAEFGFRTRMCTGTDTVFIQRAAELGILATQIIAIGFHLEASGANRNAIRTKHDAMVILGLLGITEVEIDEWDN